MKLYASGNVHYVYMTSLIFYVIGRLYPKDQENQNLLIANRYSLISCIKDKSVARY